MDLIFEVQKLEKFSENPSRVHFEGWIHLLRYIRENKTLGLKYYAYLNDAPVTDILRQAIIKTKNHLMDVSGSSWKYFPDTGIITGAYIIFYQGGPIDNGTRVPGPVAQSSAESGYSRIKDHSISVDLARYATSVAAKYLDTTTVKVITKFYKTTLPAEIIFTKEDVSTSYEQVEKLTR